MSIKNPAELVAEFKKSGEFDRLRRELLLKFRSGEDINAFETRVNDIVGQKLSSYSNTKFNSMGPDALYAELASEMDRYPLVQRAVANMPVFSDASFQAGVRNTLSRLLAESKHPNGHLEFEDASGIPARQTSGRAREGEASRSESEVNDPARHEPSRNPEQNPIISLNGRNIVNEEKYERGAQPNGASPGYRGHANNLSDEEKQDAMSEDEMYLTRRLSVEQASRPHPNGVITNGIPPNINPNRRETGMDLDNK
ncbi:hypothetical protein SCHPADRAFT_164891 [Schizopora paradoxa]|uniref:BOD1/SHG1 domain-containing protein n=1 Tax=Schizopora paradoxa TaxID=27342 RepID=A0A0H2S0L4_9AGAM|nr:hypothetical protein SCHPADRAFT_164891 [Schizopora paradoxa]